MGAVDENKWNPISALREVERNYSGWAYSYKYARVHELLTPWRNEYDMADGGRMVYIPEPIALRLGNNDVEWRVDPIREVSLPDFKTQFGVFHSVNRGEFGGKLETPSGLVASGNFDYVFDFGDNVYAIDSLRHMGTYHFGLYEFSSADKCELLYSVGGLFDPKDESLSYCAHCFTDDCLYILISGDSEILNSDGGRKYKWLTRLLRVCNGVVEKVMDIDGAFDDVRSIIVKDDVLYIGADKIVDIVDIKSGHERFLSLLSESAETDLVNTHKALYTD